VAPESKLERRARSLWNEWANWQMTTTCACCEGTRYCGRRSRRGRWLCLPCFDNSAEADRYVRSRT